MVVTETWLNIEVEAKVRLNIQIHALDDKTQVEEKQPTLKIILKSSGKHSSSE